MFSLRTPSRLSIDQRLEAFRDLPLSYGIAFNTQSGLEPYKLPHGYVLDHTRSEIGHGPPAFAAAREAFRQWHHFDLGWVRVVNPEAGIQPGAIVAVEVHALGLWSLNLSRILYVIDEPHRFGFGYGTTTHHAERGEERFVLEHDPQSGTVYYDLLAVSQPAHWMARLAYPYTRSRQHKFARDSHQRMKQIIALSQLPPNLS